jgi:hypothetical protein
MHHTTTTPFSSKQQKAAAAHVIFVIIVYSGTGATVRRQVKTLFCNKYVSLESNVYLGCPNCWTGERAVRISI